MRSTPPADRRGRCGGEAPAGCGPGAGEAAPASGGAALRAGRRCLPELHRSGRAVLAQRPDDPLARVHLRDQVEQDAPGVPDRPRHIVDEVKVETSPSRWRAMIARPLVSLLFWPRLAS